MRITVNFHVGSIRAINWDCKNDIQGQNGEVDSKGGSTGIA